MTGAVEMRLELSPFFPDDAALREAEHLKAAAVGENRTRPPDKPMEPAAPGNQLISGTQEQVVGVAEDDLGAHRLEVTVQRGLDRTLRAHRHECRRMHDAVGRREFPEARG